MIKQKKSTNFKITIFERFKQTFSKETFLSLKNIPQVMNKKEKMLFAGLGLAVILAGFFIWQKHWVNSTHEVPAIGGIYTEGIVGEAKDLDKHLARLTGAGLTRLVENGDVKGDLAESWEVKDDGKTYQFKLREGYSSADLASQIQNKNIWPNVEIQSPAENLIDFKFKQPFSPFLYASTEPIFSYGPYRITKEEKNKVILDANDQYWQGQPHISKIQLNLYPSQDELIKAAKRGEIKGYLKESKDDYETSDSTTFEFTLPRELNLFFNLSKPDLSHSDWRQNLKDNKPLPVDQNIKLTLVTSENQKNLRVAEELKNRWQGLKVDLEIKKYNNVTLQKDIIPKREYDVLLYGQDYGPDPDPYPFWHSSQIGESGMNLSNYKNKKADKLLEEARQTFDFAIRDQKYKEFRDILNADVPYINLEKETCYYTVGNEIKGINKIYGFAEADRFLNVSQWFIKSKRVK